jgi:predicted ATP-binding protein involved in virulence
MRIDRLYLADFKNLRDFEADFHISSSRQVIVGRNGVGKSNLLEAICLIFRDLDLEEAASFAYTIDYYCNRHYVRIKSSPEKGPSGEIIRFVRAYEIAEDETKNQPTESDKPRAYCSIRQPEFYQRNRALKTEEGHKLNPKRLLPSYVFG